MLQIPKEELKKILVADGLSTEEEFAAIEQEAKIANQSPAHLLLGRGVITPEYYNNILGEYYGVPLVSLDKNAVDQEILHLISEDYARQHLVLPFRRQPNGSVDVAMTDPSDLTAIQYLQKKLAAQVNPFLAPREDFGDIFALYGKKQVENFRNVIQKNIEDSLKLKTKRGEEAAQEVPIIAITDNLLSYAVSSRASDIHIEALETETLVRFRIDGVLREVIRIQKGIHPAIVARFKILGGAKLDEHAKPQDGRFRYKIGDQSIDIRLSILPTMYGEKLVLRLLGASSHILSYEELGMSKATIEKVNKNASKTFGTFLITGPTGSGKSTTMYSILNLLNKPEVNIVTVEDPIEYNMPYINQTQVNPDAGISFASALRSILRQDPNIIMVGEIRDPETAEISVHAALTGHLLLSSLHTNDAPTSIPRLADMKVPLFLISAVLNAVLAQRLVRRLCSDCIYSYEPTPEIIATIREQMKDLGLPEDVHLPKLFFKGKGCPTCGKSGYQGRMGIYEILDVDEEIRQYIVAKGFTLSGLRNLARKNGMKAMFEDGLEKAQQGQTSIEEVLRVIRE